MIFNKAPSRKEIIKTGIRLSHKMNNDLKTFAYKNCVSMNDAMKIALEKLLYNREIKF